MFYYIFILFITLSLATTYSLRSCNAGSVNYQLLQNFNSPMSLFRYVIFINSLLGIKCNLETSTESCTIDPNLFKCFSTHT